MTLPRGVLPIASNRTTPLVLASESPRRKMLLAQAGIVPDAIEAAAIDESIHRNELPRTLVLRLAQAKARKITPKQALANTRSLLEAKQAHDREALPWQALDTHSHGTAPKSGFQSEEAKDKAGELHAGESRLDAIEGSISSQDRKSQGKRDSR